MTRECRWIILVEDGRHATIGRATDPSDYELARSGEQLRGLKLGGWLAVMEGHYNRRGVLTLMMVREVAPCATSSWEKAEAAFHRIRAEMEAA